MSQKLRTALIQMTSGPDIAANAESLRASIRQAAGNGARLIVTPENTCHMRVDTKEKFETIPLEESAHPILRSAFELSRDLDVHILLGSVSVRGAGGKLLNRSYLYRAGRDEPVTYDKIHLFDADVGPSQHYRESDVFDPGSQAVLADVDGIKLGLTICYDLRFPHLYRALAQAGADVITVPAAFTVPTGEAHWHALLRARAIENGVYILAPAQVGIHAGGRRTYGHSLAIDPWGQVIAEINEPNPGIVYSDLDIDVVRTTRARIASLKHDQPFKVVHHD